MNLVVAMRLIIRAKAIAMPASHLVKSFMSEQCFLSYFLVFSFIISYFLHFTLMKTVGFAVVIPVGGRIEEGGGIAIGDRIAIRGRSKGILIEEAPVVSNRGR